MPYEKVTDAIQYGNQLYNSYPKFFHALIPVATIVTAFAGIINTRHIKKQANLQREIEGNRYKIELFEKRFNVYENYKPSLMTGDIIPNISSEIKRDQFLRTLKVAVEESSKCLLVFQKKDNGVLKELIYKQKKLYKEIDAISYYYKDIAYTEAELSEKLSRIERQKELISSMNEVITALGKTDQLDSNQNSILNSLNVDKSICEHKLKYYRKTISDIIENFPSKYLELCDAYHNANLYMEKNLSLPELAFEDDKSFIMSSWLFTLSILKYLFVTSPKLERYLAWIVLPICSAFIFFLLHYSHA
ncbi:hypothetical protein [Gluconobacter frateurii]|uniref:Uncharacterized protein n=1 Tax=Gluconobacter frateurii NRIC 0228 TaxID=1307946 RepID=A0ABQ0QFR1_9PROT|nr:hypothetical protein [Gluconobacter frateurii]GBR17449.1 hypothetical protein AA0228_3030 [Gluconobacter frateurii NRIC 0228]GLP89608.1 hypothetical protein GCM10007868_06830 [Gluconobacter frateurii]